MRLWRHSRDRSLLCGGILLALSVAPMAAEPFPQACTAATPTGSAPLDAWLALLADSNGASMDGLIAEAEPLIRSTLALETIAQGIFRDDWSELRADQRADFLEALPISLRDGLATFLREEMAGRVPAFAPRGSGDSKVAAYTLRTPDGEQKRLDVHLDGDGRGSCAIVDLEYDGDRLVRGLRERIEDLVEDYSFRYMVARLGNYDEIVFEDFESSTLGQFPIGWDRAVDRPPPYRVREEDGNRYLEATDEGESVIIGMETAWDLDEYPYVSFRLRVNRIPEGGDERTDDRVDSAAGVYVTVKKVAFGRIPESVKYVWSSTLPVGSATRREGIGKPWQVVIGSGQEGLGEWRTYVFDVRDAYRKTFGGNPGSKPAGIGILSDANSVGGQAYADYDDFKALKRAPPGTDGGVVERLRPVQRDQ